MLNAQKLLIFLSVVFPLAAVITFFTGHVSPLLLINLGLIASFFIAPAKPKVAILKVLLALFFYLLVIVSLSITLSDIDDGYIPLVLFNLYEFPGFSLYALAVIITALILRKEKKPIGLYIAFFITCLLVSCVMIAYFKNPDLIIFPMQYI